MGEQPELLFRQPAGLVGGVTDLEVMSHRSHVILHPQSCII